MFGPAGEHAVWIINSARHQIVDHDADEAGIARKDQRLAAQGKP